MSRRGSSGSMRGLRSGTTDASGGAGLASALQTAGLEMDRLRAQLLSSLTSVVADTVDMVCEEHEENFVQAAQAVRQWSGGGAAGGGAAFGRSSKSSRDARLNGGGDGDAGANDYDTFNRCCQRLVGYIDANMETSPDFKQQMDRVILACHSNASESVLGSVVTRKLWFHTKDTANGTEEDDTIEEQEGEEEDEDEVVEVRVKKPSRGKTRAAAAVKASSSRSAKPRRSATPPPPPLSRSARVKSPMKKRARREGASRKSYAPSDEESDEDEVGEEVPRKRKRRAGRIRYSDDEEEPEQHEEAQEEDGDDDDGVVLVKNDAAQQPHYGQADELLNFKDAIGDMCYADRRTPAQTRFFKDRLRKAIQFVDAQLCKPPKGKACGWECAKIRRQMCNRDLPCRNKICRLWHDVEAHTDRCQNSHCEFRIRVMLRETMYKIDHKKVELQGFRNELHTKKKALLELKSESSPDRENFVERRLLEDEIDQLEAEIENAEKDLGIFKATKKTYWATLHEIGITVEDDVNDQFQDFNAHFAEKKALKKKTPTKARSTDDTLASTKAASSRSERSRRRRSSDAADTTASLIQKRERIGRRSTQHSLKVLTNGVIELDDDDDDANEDEEAKTDRSAEYDEEASTRGPRAENVDSAEVDGDEGNPPEQVSNGEANDDVAEGQDTHRADGEEEESCEGEVQGTDTQPPSTAGGKPLDEDQSADHVIEPDEAQDETTPSTASDSTTGSALTAFNQVLDAPTTASLTETSHGHDNDGQSQGNTEGLKEGETTASVDEDNAPLLPF